MIKIASFYIIDSVMENIYKYAIIDLHLHLDGSLSPEAIIKVANEENIKLPTKNPQELKSFLAVPKDCDSLNEYLKRFDIPNYVLQTEYGLKTCYCDLIRRLAEDGLKYVEVRMAPQLSTQKGLTQDEVVHILCESTQDAEIMFGLKSNLILCMMRGNNTHEANLETIKVAKEHLGHGVVAMDLAGAEALFTNENFKEEFELINKYKIPFTIHMGEALGPLSIESGLVYNPNRIGHGVRAIENPKLVDFLVEKQIPLELCPTSNLDTKAVKSIDELPIKYYLEKGIKVTINTDDMTVSDTTLRKEFELLSKIGVTEEEMKTIALNSIDAAFISEQEKEKLRKLVL